MVLRLIYQAKTSIPVEIEGLTPDWARGKTLADIQRFEIFHGNRKLTLAEMFQVSGDANDLRFDFEGDLSGVHWIGAGMTTGQIQIQGSAGRHVGSGMRGGEITVDGDAGIWLGAEMHGGCICVRGNADHLVGSGYRGSVKGMTGGTILIRGNAGNEIGVAMRRGVIAIGGSAGDAVGFSMIAGSIFVFGDCGIRPGAGMRRGTIGLFGSNRPRLLPTFRFESTYQPQFLRLALKTLRDKGFPIEEALIDADFDLYHGDLVSVGRGEIFFRQVNAGPGRI